MDQGPSSKTQSMESYELKPEQQQGCNEQQSMTSQPPATLQPTNVQASPQGYYQPPPVLQQPTYQPPAKLQPTNVQASPQGYDQPPPVMQQPTYQHNTVVVTQQHAPQVVSPRDWTSGLCGCFDDVGICLCVIFCYGYASSEVATDTGENACLPCMINWLPALRAKVRTQLGIKGSICNDCWVDACCPCCALCQLKREVKVAKQNGLM